MNKYVIVRKSGLELAIVCFGAVSHDQAVNRKAIERDHAELVSAGFFEIRDGHIQTSSAGSNTLNLEPRPQDIHAIENTLRLMNLTPKPATHDHD
jgi:hypothetical protein